MFRRLAILLLVVVFNACRKADPPGQQVNTDKSATLNVEVRHYFLNTLGTVQDTPIRNVPVYLFQTYADADNNENLLSSKLTDSLGKVSFFKLDSLQYALRAEHPQLGVIIQTVNTPHHSVVNHVIAY